MARGGRAPLDGSWINRLDAASSDERQAMLDAAGLRRGWDMIAEAANEDTAREWLLERVERHCDAGAVLLAQVRAELQSLIFALKPRVAALDQSTKTDHLHAIVAGLERMLLHQDRPPEPGGTR